MRKPTKPTAKKSKAVTVADFMEVSLRTTALLMCNVSKAFRKKVIAHLLAHYRPEVLSEIAAGVKKLGRERAKEAA